MLFNTYADNKDGLFGVSIISAGHIFAQNGRSINRPRGRVDWLLFYVAKGCERFFLDGATDAPEGSFIFYSPGEPQQHLCISEKTAEFYYVHFDAPEDFDILGFESSRVYRAKPCAALCDLFEEIIFEMQTKDSCYEKVCVSMLFTLIARLARQSSESFGTRERYAGQIASVIQRLHREYYENRNLADYADMCRMSKFHFLRVFKEITGTSPIEYRNDLRIEHAKELLEDAALPVAEIGARVGYSSPSYFCDAFKRKTGLSPGHYRRRLENR